MWKNLGTGQLKPFPNKLLFLRLCRTSLLKTLQEKEKLLVMSSVSFSHSVFYPFGKISSIFIKYKIVACKLFQFRSLKFDIWERVKEPKYPFTRRQNFGLVNSETNCRRHFKVHLKWEKKVSHGVENIVSKGEIARYKQFLIFSQSFLLLHIFSASKCDIVW